MKKTNAENEYIDLNMCYLPEEIIPDEFTGNDSRKEGQKTPVNMYLITNEFILFLSGDNAVKVNEHFKDTGKDIGSLLEEVIRYGNRKM